MRAGPSKKYLGMYEVQANGCWHFTGAISQSGYGRCRDLQAHRFFYEQLVGPIAEGLQIDHVCHQPGECNGVSSCTHRRCVNPEHLKPATPRENSLRSNSPIAKFAVATHCVNGHPFEGDNLVTTPGRRRCRECAVAADRRTKASRRSMVLTASTLRPLHERILAALNQSPRALTDMELTERLGSVRQMVSAHRAELHRAGFITSGSPQIVGPRKHQTRTWKATA